MEVLVLKKAILLSISLGVLGFASPLVHEQVVSAETVSNGSVVPNDRQIKVTKEFYARTINGNEQHLKSVNVTLELTEDGKLHVPVEPGFTTKQSVISLQTELRRKLTLGMMAYQQWSPSITMTRMGTRL